MRLCIAKRFGFRQDYKELLKEEIKTKSDEEVRTGRGKELTKRRRRIEIMGRH